jgi:hypothetical protein
MPVFVQLTINDYSKWRLVFDKNKHLRDRAGFRNIEVYWNTDNPKEVIVTREAADVAKAREGLSAGVVGPPRVHLAA